MPKVHNIKKTQEGVYIGRKKAGMHFGNPFSHLNLSHTLKVVSRGESIRAFRQWLQGHPRWISVEPLRREWILENMHLLHGKNLLCFCSPLACHGEILLEYAAIDEMR